MRDGDDAVARLSTPDQQEGRRSRLLAARLLRCLYDGVHLRHHLVMGDAGARVVKACLHLGAEPKVVSFSFLGRDELGRDGGQLGHDSPIAQKALQCSSKQHGRDRNWHGSVRAFALVLDRPLDWTAFGVWLSMLLHAHGGRVLRVKGILNVGDGEPPVAVHGVQHLVHMPGWPDGDRRSRLVFITDRMEPGAVEASLLALAIEV